MIDHLIWLLDPRASSEIASTDLLNVQSSNTHIITYHISLQ